MEMNTFPAYRQKLLWLIDGSESFGVRRATHSLAGALRNLACQVSFVSLNVGGFADELRAAGYDIYILSEELSDGNVYKTGFIRNLLSQFKRQWQWRHRLYGIVRKTKPDWLHMRHNHLLILAGMAARETGLPVYWHLPNTINKRLPFNLQALIYQMFCRWAGIRPLGNSRHTADSLGYRFVNTRVLHLGIDATHFKPNAEFNPILRKEVGLEQSVPVFAIIARVVPEKAQDRVVEAAIQLLQAGESMQLVMIGGPADSDYYRSLQSKIDASAFGHAIKLIPPVSDPRPWFRLADVIINSRTDAEPFGLTIIESMLMERPVLACRAGGPAETVIDGSTGWLIDDLSINGYNAGMRRALKDQLKWYKMGVAARKHALLEFTIESIALKYLKIVEDELNTLT